MAAAPDAPGTQPAAKEAKSITLSENQLAAFLGLYWNTAREVAVKVSLKDGTLSARFSPNESYELKPVASSRFREVGPPVNLEFKRVTVDGPLHLFLQRDGVDHADESEHMPEFQPGPAQLATFAGAYRSEEIEPVFRLSVEDGALVLKRLKSKPDKLLPTIADYFSSSSGSLHFVRDPQGSVTGFIFNTGRIKGMKFRKSS